MPPRTDFSPTSPLWGRLRGYSWSCTTQQLSWLGSGSLGSQGSPHGPWDLCDLRSGFPKVIIYNDFSCVVPESSWLKGLIHGISRGLQYGKFGGADVTPCRFNNSQMESGAAYGFAPFSVRPAARWSSDVWSTPGPAAKPMLSKPGPVQR